MGLVRDVPVQGLLRSESKVPRSRASCSSVIGMKEPEGDEVRACFN